MSGRLWSEAASRAPETGPESTKAERRCDRAPTGVIAPQSGLVARRAARKQALIVTGGASAAADGQDLVIAAPSGTPRSLGMSLENQDWITFAPDGRRFAFVAGGGREAWHAKTLEVCGARCKPLPAPAGSISLDPTWNPRDARIAFVHAAEVGPDGGYGTNFIPNWINRRALRVQSTHSGIVHPLVRFGTGIFWPQWSRDGRMLLAFRDGEIWLGSPDGSAPKRIVRGLGRPADFFDTFMFDHGVSTGADSPVDWTGG